MSPIHRSLPVAALALALVVPACAARHDSSLASDTSGAEDVGGTESDIESLGKSLVGPSGQSLATSSVEASGELKTLGTGTATSSGAWFQPAGCIVETVDTTARTASYVFNGCTGPLGLVELTGTVSVSWDVSGNQLTLHYAASAFRINRSTIDSWQALAVVTATGSDRDMTWSAQLRGTTARGRAFTRTNDKDIKWTVGEPCVAVSGVSDGTILGAELKTTIVAFQRCADACPQAGSEVSVLNVKNGNAIDIKYSGGGDAVLTVNGRSTDIALACGI